MTDSIQFLLRSQIDTAAWNACISESSQPMIYGYSWYLDAVLPHPGWCWAGLVIYNSARGYNAVMPIPLRRKSVAGVPYSFVVHQPFFCQILGLFSSDPSLDPAPFHLVIQKQFRYGSTLNLNQPPTLSAGFTQIRPLFTLILDLSAGYGKLFNHYSRDRKRNLRRAESANWTLVHSTDLEPLLLLFQENHALTIRGGVSPQAYAILRQLYSVLQEKGLTTLQYAEQNGRVEAGALFIHEGNRIIYLFNAASDMGRKGNARTLLLDRMIRQKADDPLSPYTVFDFESPEKPAIADFYRSFGASPQPYWNGRWNHLSRLERCLLAIKKGINLR